MQGIVPCVNREPIAHAVFEAREVWASDGCRTWGGIRVAVAVTVLTLWVAVCQTATAQNSPTGSSDRRDAAIQLFRSQGKEPAQNQLVTKFAEIVDISRLRKLKSDVAVSGNGPIRVQANIGDVVRFDYGLTAVYVGDSEFNIDVRDETGASEVQSFFVYRLRFRQGSRLFDRLVYNTLPPRITREMRMFQLASSDENHKLLSAAYSWTDRDSDRGVHWLVGRKDAKPMRVYQRMNKLSTSSYDVYTSSGFIVQAMAKITELWNQKHLRIGSRSSIAGKRVFTTVSDGKSLRKKDGRVETNCFVFTGEVLEHAFTVTGRPESGQRIKSLYLTWESEKGGGTFALARYLQSLGWRTYYWNPDVRNPRDCGEYHVDSYVLTKANGNVYGKLQEDPGVPVDGFIINYDPTPKHLLPASRQAQATVKDDNSVAMLQRIQFAYGFTMGGYHSFFYTHRGLRVPQMDVNQSRGQQRSRGMVEHPGLGLVYECHWGEIGNELYEASSFFGYLYDDTMQNGESIASFVPTRLYEREVWDLIRTKHWFNGIRRTDLLKAFGDQYREQVGAATHQLELQRVVWESNGELYPQRSFLSGLLVVPPEAN